MEQFQWVRTEWFFATRATDGVAPLDAVNLRHFRYETGTFPLHVKSASLRNIRGVDVI